MDDIDFYITAMQLLHRGHFVVIGNYDDKVSLRYMTPEVLKARGMWSQLTSPNVAVRIPALFGYTRDLIEAGEERFNVRHTQ